MGMFDKIEEEARKKLIQFYEDYIENPNDKSLKEKASALDWEYGGEAVLSDIVNEASYKAFRMSVGEEKFSIEKAKEILKRLKELK